MAKKHPDTTHLDTRIFDKEKKFNKPEITELEVESVQYQEEAKQPTVIESIEVKPTLQLPEIEVHLPNVTLDSSPISSFNKANDEIIDEEAAYKIVNHLEKSSELLEKLASHLAIAISKKMSNSQVINFVNNSGGEKINPQYLLLKEYLDKYAQQLIEVIPLIISQQTAEEFSKLNIN